MWDIRVRMFTHTRRLPMTLPKNKQLDQNEIDSMKVAVEEYDIRAIHPDKMERIHPIVTYAVSKNLFEWLSFAKAKAVENRKNNLSRFLMLLKVDMIDWMVKC